MLRTFGAYALLLGLAALTSATYSTETPVRVVLASEECPKGCYCLPSDSDGTMKVVCPTEETAHMIEGAPPKDVDPSDVIDVESFIASNNSDTKIDDDNFSLKEDPVEEPAVSKAPSPVEEQPAEEQPIEEPLTFTDEEEATNSTNTPKVLANKEEEDDNFTLKPDSLVEEELMLGDQAAEASDEFDYNDDPTSIPKLEVQPSASLEPAKEDEKVSQSPEEDTNPSPTAAAEPEQNVNSTEDTEMHFSSEEDDVAPSNAPEIRASLRPLAVVPAASETPETFTLAPDPEDPEVPVATEADESKESEEEVTEDLQEVPLVFNDTVPSTQVPEIIERVKVEEVESIEDVLQPDSPTASPEGSSSVAPVILTKEMDTNRLDDILTSEDMVIGEHSEINGKILAGEEPAVTEAPQQSTASWVILGMILAMFVGVLLYAAIKGRLEGSQDLPPKVSSVSSAVAATSEFAKNRRPSDEGTEMKEMSKALLGSPLEDRVSRYIDEEDEEQIKRFIMHQELDEILEQVVVEPQDSCPVNNAVEKPPRKFIHVPPPVVPGMGGSIPNTPSLVRAKMVDIASPEVHHVSNGNSTHID